MKLIAFFEFFTKIDVKKFGFFTKKMNLSTFGSSSDRTIKLNLFNDYINSKLMKQIDDISSDKSQSKDLVIIDELKTYMHDVFDVSGLEKRSCKLVYLNEESIEKYRDRDTKTLIFIMPPQVELIPKIAQFIRNLEKQSIKKDYNIVFYPKRSIMCKYYLEKEKIYGLFEKKIRDYNMDLIPLDDDLVSLEYPLATNELFQSQEFFSLNQVSESIQRLQIIYGKIPCIMSKGDSANKVMKIMERMEKDYSKKLQIEEGSNEIDGLILQDRAVDIQTPLCSQQTYNGLLDEHIGQQLNSISVKKKTLASALGEDELKDFGEERAIPLKDDIYKQIKDKPINVVGVYTTNLMKEYQNLTKSHDVANADIAITQKLAEATKSHRFLKVHIGIAFDIQQMIDVKCLKLEQERLMGETNDDIINHCMDMILRNADLVKIYRLMCIQSIVEGGLKGKHYEKLRKEITESYGFSQMLTFQNLERNGFLTNKDMSRTQQKFLWRNLDKALKLMNEQVDTTNPKDIAFAYYGYTPVSCYQVEMALKDGWVNRDKLDKIPGEFNMRGDLSSMLKRDRKRVIVVYMIGGWAYSEVSAQRLLGKIYNVELIIATTNMINHKRYLGPQIEEVY